MYIEVSEKNLKDFEITIIQSSFLLKVKNVEAEMRIDLNSINGMTIYSEIVEEQKQENQIYSIVETLNTYIILESNFTISICFIDIPKDKVFKFYKQIEGEWIKSRQAQSFNLDKIPMSQI